MIALTELETNTHPIPLHTLIPTDEEHRLISEQLRREGYVVVPNTMTPNQCAVVQAAIHDGIQIAKGSLLLLPHNSNPAASPRCGVLAISRFQISMVSMYRLPQKEVLVTSNPNVYRAIRCAYETFADLRCEEIDHLTISKPERVNFKKAGSTHALGDHMDVSPFHPDGQLPGLRSKACR
eukprot:c20519_g1_i1.p1 GENE.c20519_g1_i1~~c20519_g1_i1.p1  ORF type:complete len:180 (-),score=32.96 c20519_g1_i1:66-605(-)